MWKIYHLPGWLILKLFWPLFSNNHLWKMRRGYTNYECFSLSEWCKFISDEMSSPQRFAQHLIVDVLWIIIIFFIGSMLFLQTAEAENIWVESAGYAVPLDNKCTLKANSDIHIRVVEKRPKWRLWDYFLWEGDLKNSEQIQIKSHSGRIRYTYIPSGSDRSYGDNWATCENNNWVSVP